MKQLKYHHLGIPTNQKRENEKYLSEYKLYIVAGYETNEFGIELMRYEKDSPVPEIVKTMPHIAFEVSDIYKAIKGKNVIIEPNSPSKGVVVAFIEDNGVPIEFLQIDT